jgi:hypothetical protein
MFPSEKHPGSSFRRSMKSMRGRNDNGERSEEAFCQWIHDASTRDSSTTDISKLWSPKSSLPPGSTVSPNVARSPRQSPKPSFFRELRILPPILTIEGVSIGECDGRRPAEFSRSFLLSSDLHPVCSLCGDNPEGLKQKRRV